MLDQVSIILSMKLWTQSITSNFNDFNKRGGNKSSSSKKKKNQDFNQTKEHNPRKFYNTFISS